MGTFQLKRNMLRLRRKNETMVTVKISLLKDGHYPRLGTIKAGVFLLAGGAVSLTLSKHQAKILSKILIKELK